MSSERTHEDADDSRAPEGEATREGYVLEAARWTDDPSDRQRVTEPVAGHGNAQVDESRGSVLRLGSG